MTKKCDDNQRRRGSSPDSQDSEKELHPWMKRVRSVEKSPERPSSVQRRPLRRTSGKELTPENPSTGQLPDHPEDWQDDGGES